MSKKKLLFVNNSLICGGVEKSLLSLLSMIDYEEYDVDLLLLSQEGLWMDNIPEQVNLLPAPDNIKYMLIPRKSILKNIVEMIKGLQFNILIQYLFYNGYGLIIRNMDVARQHWWKRSNKHIAKIGKKYDVAIAYLNFLPTYFIFDKVKSKVKMGWIHNDYTKFNIDVEVERSYYEKSDAIVTVSETSKQLLSETFPECSHKIKKIYNIVSKNTIKNITMDALAFDDSFNGIRIVTLARLIFQKGIDLAILACARLIEDGYDIRWYVFGDGPGRKEFEKLIKTYGLEDRFYLMGITAYPYDYVETADIYVHPSLTEAKSIAIDEAKILQKPILATNFTTVKDQLINEHNALIVPISSDGIYKGLKRLLDYPELRSHFTSMLKKEKLGNDNEIKVFYRLIEDLESNHPKRKTYVT